MPTDPAALIASARQECAEARALLDEAEHSLTLAVRFAVEVCGWTWAEVGAALGTTRQAACERFGPSRRRAALKP